MNRNSETQDQSSTPANDGQADLGRQIRKQRDARGWSRRELAERAGVSADTIKQIENGTRDPLPATRAKLEGAMDMSLAGSVDDAIPILREHDERCVSKRVTVTITVEEWVDPQVQSGLSK